MLKSFSHSDSFKDVSRRNLGTFQSLAGAKQISWCEEQRGTGSFMCPAIKNSRLDCKNSYKVSSSWKSWRAFGKPADILSSQGHRKVFIRCSQFRMIVSLSCFGEIQERLCYGPADLDCIPDSICSTDTEISECMCLYHKLPGTSLKEFLGMLQRAHF